MNQNPYTAVRIILQMDEIKVIDLDARERLDDKIRPQDDFFGYVNNKWLAANPIPPTESRWGSFYVLREQSWAALRDICEELSTRTDLEPGSPEQQVRDFYLSGINFDKFEEQNLTGLNALLEKADEASDIKTLAGLIGGLQAIGVNIPWGVVIDADDKDNTKHILRIRQGGLTLPDRDYYLSDSDKMKDVRQKYEKFVRTTYERLPKLAENADELWAASFGLEKSLAETHRTSVELRDVEANYNKVTYKKLRDDYQNIDWEFFASGAQWKPDDKITVDQPEFMEFINSQMTETPLETWKTYLKWHIFAHFGARVSADWAKHHFSFFGKVLAGAQEMPPLWKRVVRTMDASLGEALGQLYVKDNFPEQSKKQVLQIVDDVIKAYGERIEALDWMEASTKQYALKKLRNIKVLIGFPEKWRDYRSLSIVPESYLQNVVESELHETLYWMDKLHQPTSRDDWFMTPQTVNAYHDPNRLVICFPAAILQAPFFDPGQTDAQNYGGIGAVIGHELTHGFDDQGCLFDAEGNVRTWQTEADQKHFHERSMIISKQADEFEVLPGVYLKGGLVLGESIADLGGLEISLHALKTKLGKLNDADKREFFINFAACECGDAREEIKRQFALTDPHPESTFRVNGMVEHSDDWQELFETKDGDKLYRPPEQRAKIW